MFNFEKLESEVENKYIEKKAHKTLPLYIYNYTHKTQFDARWNNETKISRGLVIDCNKNIAARPFPKFFNLSEHQYKYPKDEIFEVTDKLDGSLGILFKYNSELVFATRGSFYSDQAIEFQKIFEEKYSNVNEFIEEGKTYLFEIIYPSNRIVLDYKDKRDIILLACIDNNTGKQIDTNLGEIFDTPIKYKFDSIEEALQDENLNTDIVNKEGYVIRFIPSDFRVKIKFEDYKRLHKILTECTSYSVWKTLKEGQNLEEFISEVPDEFYDWYKRTKNQIESEYSKIEQRAKKYFVQVVKQKFDTQRKKAEYILNSCPKELQAIIFCMLNNQDYSKIIWEKIKPEYTKPFEDK